MMVKGILTKVLSAAGLIVFSLLFAFYFYQDKLIYIPGAPIRHILDNPKGYRSPDERNIKHSHIMIQPEFPTNSDIIEGWYMYHGETEEDL